MSREIKFRAWNLKSKIMTEGLEISHLMKEEAFVLANPSDSYIFMQYTGLKDKNGKEIYEGDIMELVNADDQMNAGHMEGIGCVVWDDYDLSWKCKIGDYMIPINWGGHKSKEVIGNIHQNPELL